MSWILSVRIDSALGGVARTEYGSKSVMFGSVVLIWPRRTVRLLLRMVRLCCRVLFSQLLATSVELLLCLF